MLSRCFQAEISSRQNGTQNRMWGWRLGETEGTLSALTDSASIYRIHTHNLPDSDLEPEVAAMNEAPSSLLSWSQHSSCGRAGGWGKGRGCRGDRLSASQPKSKPLIPWVEHLIGAGQAVRCWGCRLRRCRSGPQGCFHQREELVHRCRVNSGAVWWQSSHSVEMGHRAWRCRRHSLLIIKFILCTIWGKESFLETSYKPS